MGQALSLDATDKLAYSALYTGIFVIGALFFVTAVFSFVASAMLLHAVDADDTSDDFEKAAKGIGGFNIAGLLLVGGGVIWLMLKAQKMEAHWKLILHDHRVGHSTKYTEQQMSQVKATLSGEPQSALPVVPPTTNPVSTGAPSAGATSFDATDDSGGFFG